MTVRLREFRAPRLDRAALAVGLALLAGLAPLALPGAASAQDDDEIRRHGIFVDTLDVSLVNVELVALADGEPVTDLTREDFEIFDDGEPVEITNFFQVEGGRRSVPGSGPEAEEEAKAAAEAARAPEERSFVVVLVDQAFLAPSSRAKVFHQLRERLDTLMVEGTQVMVLGKQRSIELVQRPTSDRAEVEAALDRLGKVATGNYTTIVRRKLREIEQGMWLPDLGVAIGEGAEATDVDDRQVVADAHYALSLAESTSREVFHEVRRSVALLRRFMGSLSGLPGRKAVLYVCDRLPLRPGEELWHVWYEKWGLDYGREFGITSPETAVREYDTTRDVQDLIADAAASRISFYPVGAGPVSGFNALSSENRSASISAGSLSQIADLSAGLQMLAGGTGGQAATGTGHHGWLFDRLRRDLTNYYSLAYRSPHRGDGETHKIEVRARRPGVKLQYLRKYRDKSSDQEMNDRTLASLLLEATDNPLDVQVIPGESERQKDGKYLMKMQVRFPIANLVLLPRETAHVGRVSVVFVVRDERGRLSDPVKVLVPIEVPHEGMVDALSRTAVYATTLAMRGGEQTVAVGVRDDVGAVSSTVNVNVQVSGGRG